MNDTPISAAQRTYARLAGFTCLFNYALNGYGLLVPSWIKGSGGFSERAAHILVSEHLYRSALASMAMGWCTIVILGFAQYVMLEPVNKRLAKLALYFRLGEAFVGAVTVMWSFATLRVYTQSGGAIPNEQLQAMLGVTASATDSGFYIAWTFLAPGQLLFFYLLYKSRFIPTLLPALGLFGLSVMLIANFVILTFPASITAFQYVAGPPVGIAEVGTSLWLLIRGIRAVPPRNPGGGITA